MRGLCRYNINTNCITFIREPLRVFFFVRFVWQSAVKRIQSHFKRTMNSDKPRTVQNNNIIIY